MKDNATFGEDTSARVMIIDLSLLSPENKKDFCESMQAERIDFSIYLDVEPIYNQIKLVNEDSELGNEPKDFTHIFITVKAFPDWKSIKENFNNEPLPSPKIYEIRHRNEKYFQNIDIQYITSLQPPENNESVWHAPYCLTSLLRQGKGRFSKKHEWLIDPHREFFEAQLTQMLESIANQISSVSEVSVIAAQKEKIVAQNQKIAEEQREKDILECKQLLITLIEKQTWKDLYKGFPLFFTELKFKEAPKGIVAMRRLIKAVASGEPVANEKVLQNLINQAKSSSVTQSGLWDTRQTFTQEFYNTVGKLDLNNPKESLEKIKKLAEGLSEVESKSSSKPSDSERYENKFS